MSYTDHLSASSSRQIMHDVEFSGTTFGEHVQATEGQIMHDVEFSGTTFVEHVQATEVG
ncbi:unnamed protein product [Schistosoma mattheei]|uniref:Uncharacterized protein n=1 Tax=Schistosoma mattheei TaxID=31246 RepID=A0A183NQZ4_9TREM|nr:unnamed protein product [Schistosoma mattheei]